MGIGDYGTWEVHTAVIYRAKETNIRLNRKDVLMYIKKRLILIWNIIIS